MVLLLVLLKTKVIKLEQIEQVADFFLDNITFFFIPAGVSILVSYKYLEGNFTSGLILIFTTTLIVMAVASGVAEILSRRRDHRIEKKK